MSLMRFWGTAGAMALVFGIAESAQATVLFTDGFSYEDGALSAVSATNPAGPWVAAAAGGVGPIQVIDGKAINTIDGGTEDLNHPVGTVFAPGGITYYYAAKFTVTAGTSPTINNNAYFLHFSDGGTQFFRGRLFLTQPNDTSDPVLHPFTLGIASSSTASGSIQPGVKWATDLAYDTEYTVVVSYTTDDDDVTDPTLMNDGFSSLWINPASQASTSITDIMPNVNINTDLAEATKQRAIVIRQPGGGNNQPHIAIDILSVATTFNEALAALTPAPANNNSDFNNDTIVDGKDFVIWQQGNGLTGQPDKLTGDATGGGTVDVADLNIWKTKYGGAPAVAAAGPVPEPSAMALAIFGLAAFATRRRAA